MSEAERSLDKISSSLSSTVISRTRAILVGLSSGSRKIPLTEPDVDLDTEGEPWVWLTWPERRLFIIVTPDIMEVKWLPRGADIGTGKFSVLPFTTTDDLLDALPVVVPELQE